jgi:hypothetical protein
VEGEKGDGDEILAYRDCSNTNVSYVATNDASPVRT